MTRTTARATAALAAAVVAVVLVASPAQAAAYRYWTYWQAPAGAVAWAFGTQGPGTSVPADGDVEGWSFAVSTESANADDAPASAPDFAAICGATPVQVDSKRVALIIDPGPAGLAPDGETPPAPVTTCIVVPPDATGYDVLRAAATVRTEDGLVCAIADYPARECATVLDDAEAAALLAEAADADPTPSPLPSVTGLPAGPDGERRRGRRLPSRDPARRRPPDSRGGVRVEPVPGATMTTDPRWLHPGAWWLWALGLAAAASRTTNPLILALLIGAAFVVVSARKPDAPWARSFTFFLRLGVIVIVVRVAVQVLFGASVGTTVLVGLPGIGLPEWLAGVRLGGDVTLESLLLAFYDGLRLATILICVGAANSLASPTRLLKSVPAALYELGVSVVVALTFTPQLVADVDRLTTARRLRGRETSGPRAIAASAVPVLEGALERSVMLAAAMDSRGYGRRGTVPARRRRLVSALLLGGLVAACIGVFGLVSADSPVVLGPADAGDRRRHGGRGHGPRRPGHRPHALPPRPVASCRSGSWAAPGSRPALLIAGAAWLGVAGLTAAIDPPAWPQLPLVGLVAALLGATPALTAPPPAPERPARQQRDDADRATRGGGRMIVFDDVTVTYPGASAPALAHVNLRIPEGELVLVVGRTGSGKTTLLRAINGLVPHFTGGTLQGRVVVDGRDTAHHPPRELADLVGVVPQDPMSGFVTDTVEDELAYGMECLGIAPDVMRRRVEETLDLLGLADIRQRPLRSLSGGQRQRVAIGAVLAAHPRVLVLDEPTSALDPGAAEEVLAALQRLVHDLGVTVVMAEHRLERVVQYADQIVIVPGGGQPVRSGSPAEVMRSAPIAPPVVELGRLAGWRPLPLSVRDARRAAGPAARPARRPHPAPAARPRARARPRDGRRTSSCGTATASP